MQMFLRNMAAIVLSFVICSQGWALNSLVDPKDIQKMKKAGISESVIQVLASEQTSSVTPSLIMKLHKAGADDKLLQAVILGDRYKNPQKADIMEGQMELLKTAGFSEEEIEGLFRIPAVRTVVDAQGNEHVIYTTGSENKKESGTPSSDANYHINIERVGTTRGSE